MSGTSLCELESYGTHSVVRLRAGSNDQIWSALESQGDRITGQLESKEAPACVVDLSELNYIGSSLVAFIVRIWKAIRKKEGRMAVVCRHPNVQEVIHLAGLDKVWTICSSTEEAIQSIGVRPVRETAPWGLLLALAALLAAGTIVVLIEQNSVPAGLGRAIYAGLAVLGVVLAGWGTYSQTGGRRWVSATLLLVGCGMLLLLLPNNLPLLRQLQPEVEPAADTTEPENYLAPLDVEGTAPAAPPHDAAPAAPPETKPVEESSAATAADAL